MNDLLNDLCQTLDASLPALSGLDKYYAGRQPMAYLSPEAQVALGTRFGVMASNLPRLAVTALAERLRVTGFRVAGGPAPALWASWLASDLDQTSGTAHREALALGRAYAMTWAGPDGKARTTIESAHQVATLTDPGSRETIAAVKRWEVPTRPGEPGRTLAVLYEPDRITRLSSAHPGASAAAFTVVETLDNPLGQVPVTTLTNGDRLLDAGVSEMADLVPLCDALNKCLADMLVASEYYARPRRWATGLELEEVPVLDVNGMPTGDTTTVNPIPDSSRVMINEAPEGKFGSLPAADLAAYEAAVRVLTSQIMAVSSLPAHYVGVFASNPTSADSLRASEASLAARAEARQATFGRAWERVGRLHLAIDTRTDPAEHDVNVQWADPSTRSVAQEADAVTKLYSVGLLPASIALARLGYSADEIATIETARTASAPQPAPNTTAA